MTAWTIACQALLSMGFLRQEYCSGLPFPPPGAFLNLGMELVSSVLAGGFFATEPPGKPGKRIERVIFVYALRRGDYFKPSY